MNIVYSCGSYSWGGLEIQTLVLAKTFKDKGHSIFLLAPKNSTLAKKGKEENIDVIELNWKNKNLIKNIYYLRQLFSKIKPQIIHTQLSHDLWVLSPSLNKHGRIILTKRMASSVVKKDFFHKYLYGKVSLILCISKYIKTNVLHTVPINAEKVKIHHNSIDYLRFNLDISLRNQFRKKHTISDETIVVGLLGRFTPLKGHKEFFDALKIITETHPDINLRFLVAGGDSFGEENFGKKIREYGSSLLGDKLIFTGQTSNSPEVLSAMDIFAFPSHEESFGNVLCEAGAMEIPVVASNSGGVTDIVVDNKTGLLFEVKNAKDMADKLLVYIKDPQLRLEHGKNARAHIIENFDPQKQIKNLENIYQPLI